MTLVEDFNDYLGNTISNKNVDTIGRYIIQQIGHLPKRGEVVNIDLLKIIIMLANKRSIQLLRLTRAFNPSDCRE